MTTREDEMVAVRDAILKSAFNDDPKWLDLATDAARAALTTLSSEREILREALEQISAFAKARTSESSACSFIWRAADTALTGVKGG